MSPDDLRASALEGVRACTTLLQERYGARRVILFGSLAGHAPWHSRSDVDLAVEGLADEDFFPAYSACIDVLPRGIELDLVQLEKAYPELRARILGGNRAATSQSRGSTRMTECERERGKEGLVADGDRISALLALIQDEFAALQRVVDRTEEARTTLPDDPSQFELHGLAAYVHKFYTGVETIFERIAVWLREPMPMGSEWHRDLLRQMAEPVEGIRPRVIDESLRGTLGEYLRFRHFFRHAYSYDLEWVRLRPFVVGMAETFETLRAQVIACLGSLEQS